MYKFFSLIFLIVVSSCNSKETSVIERLDPSLDLIIPTNPEVEIIASGFEWSEGPLWIESKKMLLFSDVPKNTIYKWTEEHGKEIYLTPSGYTGTQYGQGSNGLLLDDEENLILCQHGDRRLAIMDAPLESPKAEFITIADQFDGKKFNSPNDAVFYNYSFYFTDPAYGLEKQMDDPSKELPYQGVFRINSEGEVKLLVDTLTRPNGLAFIPNQKTLIIANSDSNKARWYAYTLSENDSITSSRILYDATENAKTEKGLPDGLKIDSNGNIFATGPGGIWIFNATGKLLGKIKINEVTSNCALSADEKTLFVTADMNVLRIKLR
jgi:gluconolactonase